MLQTFWLSCLFDGLLVFTFVLLKSIMPVFLGQLLLQFQLPPKSNDTTSLDNYENATTSTALPTARLLTTTAAAAAAGMDSSENGAADGDFWDRIFQYIVFAW